jgi:hypothetical protein
LYRLGVWLFIIAIAMLIESVSGLAAESGTASLGFSVTSYPSANRADPGLDLSAEASTTGDGIGAKGSIFSRYILNNSHDYALELPELYAWTSLGAHATAVGPTATSDDFTQLTAGRKLEHWSRLDEEWELGLWQPRYRWDYLHPMSVGLTGAFLDLKSGPVRITGFASPLFIPERGAPVEQVGGGLQSDSPWFISPVRAATVDGVPTQVNYSIDTPALSDIVFHAGGALKVEVGEEQGPWISAGYARKPMNQLAFGVNGFYNLGPGVIEGIVHPRVLDQDLVSVETGYTDGPLKLWAGFTFEHPIRDDAPSDWTTQEFQDARIWSPGATLSLGRDAEASLSYLYVSGGNAGDSKGTISTGTPGSSVFDYRYPFTSAVKLRGATTIPGLLKGRLRSESSLLVGNGLIWSTAFTYAPESGRGFAALLGTDILAANTDSATADDFISRNRANHEIRAGVSYAF